MENQQTIQFEGYSVSRTQRISFTEKITAVINNTNKWLDAKSLFYSRICEYSVTRRLVIRVNLISVCMMIGAVCIEQKPIIAISAAAAAAYLVYRLNHSNETNRKKEMN